MASRAKVKKQKAKSEEDLSNYTLGQLKKFIKAVEKKYGKGALEFPVEVHRPYTIEGEKGQFWAPHELETLSIAKYEGDKFQTVIIR